MAKRKNQPVVCWDDDPPNGSSAKVKEIDHFDARGKRLLYGRSEYFDKLALHLNVWRGRGGRIFARFWSRSEDVDWYSYEVVAVNRPGRSHKQAADPIGEDCVPMSLRDEFEDWVLSEMPFVFSDHRSSHT